MSQTVISVENLSKAYRLGQINTGTFSYDLQLWWARLRGKPNPFWRIGDTDDGNRVGETLWALKDVSFTVEQGEVLGIIGRNGAGKSTLLKILSRVTAPTSGRIRVKGRIASLLEVGTGFHPELTGRENIYLNGAILGMKRDEITRKFGEIVDFAEIEKFIDTPVKRYSSGMYVRLAFAVAAHLEPDILVVDEVLAVGDAEFQKKCLGKMGEVAKEGRTVLFVSHNMGAMSRLTSRCSWLDHGTLVETRNTADVVRDYLHELVEKGTGAVIHKSNLLQISDFKITSTSNIDSRKTSLPFGTEFTASFKLGGLIDISNVSFLLTIHTDDGLKLATMNSTDQNLCLDIEVGKQYAIAWKILSNFLTPGVYWVGLSLHDQMRNTILDIDQIGSIEILKINAPERIVIRETMRAGHFILPGSWTISECR
jgi:lipopolysaccharide transport system ATP-binding protein